jgi:hypothetical protein
MHNARTIDTCDLLSARAFKRSNSHIGLVLTLVFLEITVGEHHEISAANIMIVFFICLINLSQGAFVTRWDNGAGQPPELAPMVR